VDTCPICENAKPENRVICDACREKYTHQLDNGRWVVAVWYQNRYEAPCKHQSGRWFGPLDYVADWIYSRRSDAARRAAKLYGCPW
jgi:hypothetical protein